MSLAGIAATIIATIGGVHLLSKALARSDARPRPLRYTDVINEAFQGDLIALPAEAKRAGGETTLAGGGSKAHRLVTHESGLNRTGRRGAF